MIYYTYLENTWTDRSVESPESVLLSVTSLWYPGRKEHNVTALSIYGLDTCVISDVITPSCRRREAWTLCGMLPSGAPDSARTSELPGLEWNLDLDFWYIFFKFGKPEARTCLIETERGRTLGIMLEKQY